MAKERGDDMAAFIDEDDDNSILDSQEPQD
jgi:hypothetical protein